MEEETKKEEETQIKKRGAKKMSAFAMFFSSTWIAGLTILKGLEVISLSVQEIIYTGLAMTAVWCPTFVWIYFDKIKILKDVNKW